jgi:hypothetical protein
MNARLRRAAVALQDFARGFLGLAAPAAGGPPASDPAAARAALAARARRRGRCC